MIKIIVLLTRDDYRSLENSMRLQVQDENKITIHKMTEAQTKQQWYREVIREGLRVKLQNFDKKKKEIEAQEDEGSSESE